MRQALEKMNLRVELMSRWRGDEYHEMAKELMRMACFFSLQGEYAKTKELLEQSLRVIKSTPGGDVRREIDLLKLLAATYDALGNTDEAIKFYSVAIDLRKKTKRDIDDPSQFLQESCTLLVSFAFEYSWLQYIEVKFTHIFSLGYLLECDRLLLLNNRRL